MKNILKCANCRNSKSFAVDESILIKICRRGTQRLLNDYHLFDFRIILNGTPITKSLLDLYAQISFLSPNILKMTERQFADNFLVYFFDGRDPFPWRRWSKPANVEALVEIIRPYIFNANLKTDCRIRVYNRNLNWIPLKGATIQF
ncbi:MAG: SNF2-related protein [Bacilli bacterium]